MAIGNLNKSKKTTLTTTTPLKLAILVFYMLTHRAAFTYSLSKNE